MAVVISDTSPVRALAHLGLLHLFGAIFGEVLIPAAVADELEHPERPRFVPIVLSTHPFLRLRAASDVHRVTELCQFIDSGEAEAIALAEEVRADEIVIDETRARRLAMQLKLPVVGTLGVLLRAKDAGLIPAVIPLVDRLRAELGFFVSDEVHATVRRIAKE